MSRIEDEKTLNMITRRPFGLAFTSAAFAGGSRPFRHLNTQRTGV